MVLGQGRLARYQLLCWESYVPKPLTSCHTAVTDAKPEWRVAARKPKGLAAIVPWEGMSDYYRDRCRHGGILSNAFIKFWWNRQVITNQYGRPGRAASNWGPGMVHRRQWL